MNVTIKSFSKATLLLFKRKRFQFDETHHLLVRADLISWAKTHIAYYRENRRCFISC